MYEGRKYFAYRQQIVRGICILAVIAIHISNSGAWFFRFAVPVFILVSGFQLSLSNRNERAISFYKRVLPHLAIPYLAYSVIFSIPHVTRGIGFCQLWNAFLSSDIEQHLWFMPVIISLYILYPWLRRIYRTSSVGTLVFAFILQIIVWPNLKEHLLSGGALTTALSFASEIGFFVSGFLLLDYSQQAKTFCERKEGKLLSLLIWLIWPYLNSITGNSEVPLLINKVLYVASCCSAFFLIASIAKAPFHLTKLAFNWVGRFGLYSFGIYLFHPIAISVVSLCLTQTLGFEYYSTMWQLIVYPLAVLLSYFAIKWVSKIPGGRFFA